MFLFASFFRMIVLPFVLFTQVVLPFVATAQDVTDTVSGTIMDEQGDPVTEPVLVEITDTVSDSVLVSAWSNDVGHFRLDLDSVRRVRLVARRFGRAAIYRVETVLDEASERSSIRIVLPEPVAAAIVPASGTYHDKNQALMEGMLAGAQIDLPGESRHSVFAADHPRAVIRFLPRAGLLSQMDVHLSRSVPDSNGVAADSIETICATSGVCFLSLDPGTYRLELNPRSSPQVFELTFELGLTTFWIE
jgi:hypothetical protein